ncbi:hypothetical protein SLS62_001870 [Diatrype stigma]|uniref:Uncharacterized protein n=1 Tax=Diatrype stigma TaxID=117547 RepID=A0AAN9YVT9_9PEZI
MMGVWYTGTFKNDERIYQKVIELHSQFVGEWKAQSPDGDFYTQALFQALPTLFAKHSVEKGGNVLGLDRETENMIIVQFNIAVKGVEQETLAREKSRQFGVALRAYGESVGCNVPWLYLNYADYYQDPLGSYGGVNIAKIRAAALKYDPDKVFQNRSPGGFKISRHLG